jgi:hypothetical protein
MFTWDESDKNGENKSIHHGFLLKENKFVYIIHSDFAPRNSLQLIPNFQRSFKRHLRLTVSMLE